MNWGPIWGSVAEKGMKECCDEAGGCNVVVHVDDVGPVGVAINYDEEIISAEVNYLKWSKWFWFHREWLLGK